MRIETTNDPRVFLVFDHDEKNIGSLIKYPGDEVKYVPTDPRPLTQHELLEIACFMCSVR